jgi:hypothetical protein
VAVLVAAGAMTGLATPFLPGPPGLGAAWVLPSLLLTGAALARYGRVPMALAATMLASCWLGVVLFLGGISGDRFGPFHPQAQILYGCAALIMVLLIYKRHREPEGDPR